MDISYSEVRQNLKNTINWTTDNHEPAFITTHNKRAAVLLSYDDYCSLEETAYLLRSPANAQRLLRAIKDIDENRNLQSHDLIKDES